MRQQSAASQYLAALHGRFREYREARFEGRDEEFERRPLGGPTVFKSEFRDNNILLPCFATAEERQRVIRSIPGNGRQKQSGSMRSSQALTQSVFGAIAVGVRRDFLGAIHADDGSSAFGPSPRNADLVLEKAVSWLNEPRATSVDCWIGGGHRVAVECKFSEADFGKCSRPNLKPEKAGYCDGSYTVQHGRTERCSLTKQGIRYWDHLGDLFSWKADEDQRPCSFRSVYQLGRNVLAACVDGDGKLDARNGHALIIYDERNPAMAVGGLGEGQWQAAAGALRDSTRLRRLSWQSFIRQWPSNQWLDWLRTELETKYGLLAR